MCRQCQTNLVYEFTNQRKLCKNCFIKYFQKKVLYIIRKFGMIKNNDVVGYIENNDFRGVVLEDVLKMFGEKGRVKIVKLRSQIDNFANSRPRLQSGAMERFAKSLGLCKALRKNSIDVKNFCDNLVLAEKSGEADFGAINNRATEERGNYNKRVRIAISTTIDSSADKIIYELIKGQVKDLKNVEPVVGKVIKPLYLFLDEEVLLYAKLRKLKFKRIKESKDKITKFIDELEKKHPEVKRAIVKSYLALHQS